MSAHGAMTTKLGADGKFSADQERFFRKEDVAAGRAIITLMTAVFTAGLLGSATVCLVLLMQ